MQFHGKNRNLREVELNDIKSGLIALGLKSYLVKFINGLSLPISRQISPLQIISLSGFLLVVLVLLLAPISWELTLLPSILAG